jgi:hypothetical protein
MSRFMENSLLFILEEKDNNNNNNLITVQYDGKYIINCTCGLKKCNHESIMMQLLYDCYYYSNENYNIKEFMYNNEINVINDQKKINIHIKDNLFCYECSCGNTKCNHISKFVSSNYYSYIKKKNIDSSSNNFSHIHMR